MPVPSKYAMSTLVNWFFSDGVELAEVSEETDAMFSVYVYNWIRVLIKQFDNRTSLNVTSSASVDIASRIRILIEQFDNQTSLIYLISSNPTIIILFLFF